MFDSQLKATSYNVVGTSVEMCSTVGVTLRTMEDYPEYSQFDVIKILINTYSGKICIQLNNVVLKLPCKFQIHFRYQEIQELFILWQPCW